MAGWHWQAYDWLSLAPLFLDTETTGLDNTAEALEIGLTDAAGQVVFETRLKPTVEFYGKAYSTQLKKDFVREVMMQ